MPEFVTSADGTRIAFERRGAGPAIVLIGGILSDRGWVTPLGEALSHRFTTIAVDRRGRGDSGDGTDYAVAREVEDIAALIGVAGDQPALYGHSSGAPLALRAAAEGLPIGRLVLYEPPYSPEDAPEEAESYVAVVMGHLAAGRRAEAITAFMEASGVPAQMAAAMAADPARLRAAPSMANDLALMDVARGGRLPTDLAARVAVPTLILAGDQSPDFFHATAWRLVLSQGDITLDASLGDELWASLSHGSATTTEAFRRALPRSEKSVRALTRRYGIIPRTVQKWRRRTSVADRPMGPADPHSTVLTLEKEAMIVAFRRHTLLPLDDCLYAQQPSIPELTLFVAIYRTSKFAVARLYTEATRPTACQFLKELLEVVPYCIHILLTDNGIQFAEQPRCRNIAFSRQSRFGMVFEANGIEHRLTKPNHQWSEEGQPTVRGTIGPTNGQGPSERPARSRTPPRSATTMTATTNSRSTSICSSTPPTTPAA